jgi:hypothetical protein
MFMDNSLPHILNNGFDHHKIFLNPPKKNHSSIFFFLFNDLKLPEFNENPPLPEIPTHQIQTYYTLFIHK